MLRRHSNNIPEPALVCITETVEPFFISLGDVLGFTWSKGRELPLLGNADDGTSILDLARNQSLDEVSMHLSAVVENQHAGNSNVAASVSAVIVILGIAIAATVVAVVLWYWKRQRRKLTGEITAASKCND